MSEHLFIASLLLLFAVLFLAHALVTAWGAYEAHALSVYCPKCGAHRGEQCYGLSRREPRGA